MTTTTTHHPDTPLPPDFPDRAAFEAEWVAALRSGEYRQGKSQLRNGDHFCCLGVACDIAIRHGIGQWKRDCYASPNETAVFRRLPKWVANYLGRTPFGSDDLDGSRSLSTLNDNNVSFDVIAGVIEGSVAYADAEKAMVSS